VLQQRNEELSERIGSGDADDGDFREAVLSHVRLVVRNKLTVTNPSWIED